MANITEDNQQYIQGHVQRKFALEANGVTNGDSHNHAGGDGGQIAHSGLSGLTSGDPHSQYLLLAGRSGQTVTGDLGLTADLVPTTDSNSDLGDSTHYFKNAYLDAVLTSARLSMRPTLIASKIVKVGADYFVKPTQVDYGASSGYSLPIYASDDEELFFNEMIAGRWDGASDITVSVTGYLSAAEDVDDDFALQLSWANKTPSSGVVPSATTDVEVRTNIATGRSAQYSIYKVDFTIDWDAGTPDIASSDIFLGRLRRIAVGGGYTEMSGEFVVLAVVVTYTVNKMYKAT